MSFRIRLSEFAQMSEPEKIAAIRRLMKEAMAPPTAEKLSEICEEIKALENDHGMTSEEMRNALKAGKLQESNEICHWLITLNRLATLTKRAGVSGCVTCDSPTDLPTESGL